MAFPPPSSDLETAVVMGYPAQTPPNGHKTHLHNSSFPQSHKPLAPSSTAQQPVCKCSKSPWLYEARATFLVVSSAFTCVAVAMIFIFFLSLFMGPPYPIVQVSGLNVSGLAAAATTNATWKASLVVHQELLVFGNSSFQDMECVLYYQWDAAKPLALASVDPFVLRGGERAEVNGNMTMNSTDKGAVEEMHREQKTLGTVAVGLGLKMEGTYIIGSWWRKNYARMQAYCDNLKIVFTASGEGHLVTDQILSFCSFFPIDCEASWSNSYDPTLIRCH